MPHSSTLTSKPYVLTLEGTENMIVEDFVNLQYVIQTSPEDGLLPECVFLFFTSKRDKATAEAMDPLCNEAEKTVIDYLRCISDSKKKDIKLIQCQIKEEELHLLSLNKVFPRCNLENIKYLPALMRLDGVRILYRNDLCNFRKLDLMFSQTKKFAISPIKHTVNIEPKPRSLVLNLRRDDCSFHGNVDKPDLKVDYFSDNEMEEVRDENRSECSYNSLGKILYLKKRTFEVERKPLVEPVIELPPEPSAPKRKPGKKGKGKKGKGKKGKGKGGKGKGGKGKGKKGKK